MPHKDNSDTLYERIAVHAAHQPDAPAILAPERTTLTYQKLLNQIDETREVLNAAGIGRNDRVAIVLPNGPEVAVAFLSVIGSATAAPLNPAYRHDEFHFYLSDLGAKALIVLAGEDSPAVDVANELKVCVIRLTPLSDEAAGRFQLSADCAASLSAGGSAQADDIALVLHTSGTTSRPKIVPLTQRNIAISAANIMHSLELTPADRCLNVMPLFHVHGLMGALLSSMTAGGSVIASPGFYAPRFFEWMDDCQPTWYTAVPTMQQSILERAQDNANIIERNPQRFIRSSSASMPPQVIHELESIFSAPFVEAYGMTEASHQMAINPLPPGVRKPGSVGLATGPEIGIMDETGNLLQAGAIGEIVIKGPSVTAGYENNPEANASGFTDGWFRTGDQGYLDEDGYLFLTGRIKELINRGGEKISPREVDEVLLDHPDVVQVVTFAVPDPRLGEEVAAAIILTEGSTVSERQLREFAALRLTSFKVPRTIVFVDEIPKGPTGKLQRIGLADKLGVSAASVEDRETAEFIAPQSEIERQLAAIWADVLGLDLAIVGVKSRFEDLGGDSMLAMAVVSRVREELGIEVTLLDFNDTPTIEGMAGIVQDKLTV